MTTTAVRWITSTSWELPFFGLPQEIPWPEGVDPAIANQQPLDVEPLLDAIEAMGADAPEPWRGFLAASEFHNNLIEALEHQETGDAVEALDEIEQRQPGTPFVLFHRAHLAKISGNEDEAFQLYHAAAEKAPQVAPIWSNIGALHLLRGEREQALAAFHQALALAPQDRLAMEGLTSLKERVKLRSADPKTPDAFHYVDVPTFRQLAQQRLESMTNPDELMTYSDQLLRDGSAPEEGVRAIERAAQLRPGDARVALTLSAAYRHVGQHEKSLSILEQFTAQLPQEPVGFLQQAQTHHAMGNEAGEMAALDRVLELDPNAQPALAARFRIIPGAHDHTVENALVEFARARGSWMALLLASAIARERGDNPSVFRHTKEAFALAPENEEVLVNYTSAIGDQKEVALLAQIIKPAVESGKYGRRLAWTYGHVLRLLNMTSDAARVLREAAQDAPDDFKEMVATTIDAWSGFVTGSGARLEIHQAGFVARPILIALEDGDGGVLIAAGTPFPAEARFPWKAGSDNKAVVALQQGETGHGKEPLELGLFLVRNVRTGLGVKPTIDCHLQANADGTLHFRASQAGHKLPVGWAPRPSLK